MPRRRGEALHKQGAGAKRTQPPAAQGTGERAPPQQQDPFVTDPWDTDAAWNGKSQQAQAPQQQAPAQQQSQQQQQQQQQTSQAQQQPQQPPQQHLQGNVFQPQQAPSWEATGGWASMPDAYSGTNQGWATAQPQPPQQQQQQQQGQGGSGTFSTPWIPSGNSKADHAAPASTPWQPNSWALPAQQPAQQQPQQQQQRYGNSSDPFQVNDAELPQWNAPQQAPQRRQKAQRGEPTYGRAAESHDAAGGFAAWEVPGAAQANAPPPGVAVTAPARRSKQRAGGGATLGSSSSFTLFQGRHKAGYANRRRGSRDEDEVVAEDEHTGSDGSGSLSDADTFRSSRSEKTALLNFENLFATAEDPLDDPMQHRFAKGKSEPTPEEVAEEAYELGFIVNESIRCGGVQFVFSFC